MPNPANYSDTLSSLRPIIIVGMHRSGTSLMSRLLHDLGIHMGGWLSRDAEAVFFQKINRKIIRPSGAHWAEPESLLEMMSSDQFIQTQVELVRARLIGPGVRFGLWPRIQQDLGSDLWQQLAGGADIPWGFKDPRTALVIPIWRQVFPQARWVHIYRSGVDVALSLHRRTLRQQKKLLLKLYRFDFSKRTLDFGYCFNLWEVYLDVIHQALSEVDPAQVFELRYEDLLEDPAVGLKKVLDFVGVSKQSSEIERAVMQVNRGRLDNRAAVQEYRVLIDGLPDSRWMETFEYSLRER